MTDWLDDDALADQYADASNLAARQVLHARFSTADRSRHVWLFDQFDLPSWSTALATFLSYGLVLLAMTVLLFLVPYGIFRFL
jgi:hypothetical protein